LLARKTPREILKEASTEEYDILPSYDQEINKEASSIYEKNKIFNKQSIDEGKIAPLNISRMSKKIRKLQQEETTGDGWYGMKKKILTPELKDELNAIKLRGYIDPKKFYKSPDWAALPEYFQIGTVIDGGDEPKSMKMKKRDKKGTLVDQFLSEDKDASWTKNKFNEIQSKKKKVIRKKLDKFKKMKKRGIVRG